MNFSAQVGVHRLTDVENGPVKAFTAEVRIHCVDCGQAFAFIGLPWGSHPSSPTMSVGGEEARLPIEPTSKAILRASAIAGSA
jgi:hypothetical protein